LEPTLPLIRKPKPGKSYLDIWAPLLKGVFHALFMPGRSNPRLSENQRQRYFSLSSPLPIMILIKHYSTISLHSCQL